MDIEYPETNIIKILSTPWTEGEREEKVFLGKLLRAVAVADGMPGKRRRDTSNQTLYVKTGWESKNK